MLVLKKISDWIARISEILSGIIIGTMTVIMILQVILRFGFNSGIAWSEEFARMAIIWAVMLVANVLVKNDELISVDFFDTFWSEKFLKWRKVFYQLIFFVLIFILIKEGWVQAVEGLNRTTTAMEIKWFFPYLSIPLGAVLILYQYLYKLMEDFKRGTS